MLRRRSRSYALKAGGGSNIMTSMVSETYALRVNADSGTQEGAQCLNNVLEDLSDENLLSSATFLMVPSGYKSGKVYSQLPLNGNGDLTFTRASTATRVNINGIIENVASGLPRLSYATGACPTLLLEPQRTNLFQHSADFTNAFWGKTAPSTVVTDDQYMSPGGTTTADKLSESANTQEFKIFRASVTGLTTSTNYVISVFARAAERKYAYVQTAGVQGQYFDLQNGVKLGNTGVAPVDSGMIPYPDGWYRLWVVVNTGGGTSLIPEIGVSDNGSRRSYLGTAGNGIFLWGAQFEVGSFLTTYIPTTSGTVTRLADSFTRSNVYTNGLISAQGGTWLVELKNNLSLTRDASSEGIFLGDTTDGQTNSLQISAPSSAGRLSVKKRVSGTATNLYTTAASTVKVAIKWNGTTADVFVNGTKQVSATAFTATQLEYLYGLATDVPKYIAQMALWNTPLSDSQCETLSSL